jgi:hypothetical protein
MLLWKAISSMTLKIFELLDPLDSFIVAATTRLSLSDIAGGAEP